MCVCVCVDCVCLCDCYWMPVCVSDPTGWFRKYASRFLRIGMLLPCAVFDCLARFQTDLQQIRCTNHPGPSERNPQAAEQGDVSR